VYNLNVITTIVFHLRNKILQLRQMPITYNTDLYVLCDILQFNIINIIFGKDNIHFHFYSLATGFPPFLVKKFFMTFHDLQGSLSMTAQCLATMHHFLPIRLRMNFP